MNFDEDLDYASKRTAVLEWHSLLHIERDCAAAAHKAATEDSLKLTELTQDWWKAVADLLDYFLFARDRGVELQPPVSVIRSLGLFSRHIASGQVPEAITNVANGRGRRGMGPTEARHIALAGEYVRASRLGWIKDRYPVKTVRLAYNVERQTVQGWAERPLPNYLLYVSSLEPDELKRSMETAGSYYQQAGRGHGAVRRRDKRKTTS